MHETAQSGGSAHRSSLQKYGYWPRDVSCNANGYSLDFGGLCRPVHLVCVRKDGGGSGI